GKHVVGVALVILPTAMWRVAHMGKRMQAAAGKGHEGEERAIHDCDAEPAQRLRYIHQSHLGELMLQGRVRAGELAAHGVQTGVSAVEYIAGRHWRREFCGLAACESHGISVLARC